MRTDYEPSNLDILNAEGVTSSNGLACVDFSFSPSAPDDDIDAADQNDSLLRWVRYSLHVICLFVDQPSVLLWILKVGGLRVLIVFFFFL